jgi:hypothetical protein
VVELADKAQAGMTCGDNGLRDVAR